MITVEDFRKKLRENEIEFLLEEVLLADYAAHVDRCDIEYLKMTLSAGFGIQSDSVKVWIVGSAKLGFSLVEKRKSSGVLLPRYREFSAESDVDVAVVSACLFDLIWEEISAYSHRVRRLPWDSGQLGDYLVCGWLRPDDFPKKVRLRRCDDWWDIFRRLSVDARYGRRKVRGGLFHSMEHMKRYQSRALKECVDVETLNL